MISPSTTSPVFSKPSFWCTRSDAALSGVVAEMNRLMADPVHIDSVLAQGAKRAQVIAAETMKAVKGIVGLVHR